MSRSIPRSRRPRSRSPPTTRAPAPRRSRAPWPRRSRSSYRASRTSSTSTRPRPPTARSPSPAPSRSAPTSTRRPSTSTTACRSPLPRLPDDVRRTGVLVQKRSLDILMVVAHPLDGSALRHALPQQLRHDQRARRPQAPAGRGRCLHLRRARLLDARLAASPTGWRAWVSPPATSPMRCAPRTPSTPPARSARNRRPTDQAFVYTVTTRGRLVEPEEFGNIVLRASGPGGVLRLKDVARLELGAQNYDAFTTRGRQADHRHGHLPAVRRQRARRGATRCARRMDELAKSFPAGRRLHHAASTPRASCDASIHEVVMTLMRSGDPRARWSCSSSCRAGAPR